MFPSLDVKAGNDDNVTDVSGNMLLKEFVKFSADPVVFAILFCVEGNEEDEEKDGRISRGGVSFVVTTDSSSSSGKSIVIAVISVLTGEAVVLTRLGFTASAFIGTEEEDDTICTVLILDDTMTPGGVDAFIFTDGVEEEVGRCFDSL